MIVGAGLAGEQKGAIQAPLLVPEQHNQVINYFGISKNNHSGTRYSP